MKRAHYLAARVLSKPLDISSNSDSLKSLLSCLNNSKEITIDTLDAETPTSPVLLTSFLKRESDINHLFKFLVSTMSASEKEIIFKETEKYVDDHLDFFLRFERETWTNGKKLNLTTTGDCFHLTFSMAAYPKNKGSAIELVKQIFKTE